MNVCRYESIHYAFRRSLKFVVIFPLFWCDYGCQNWSVFKHALYFNWRSLFILIESFSTSKRLYYYKVELNDFGFYYSLFTLRKLYRVIWRMHGKYASLKVFRWSSNWFSDDHTMIKFLDHTHAHHLTCLQREILIANCTRNICITTYH